MLLEQYRHNSQQSFLVEEAVQLAQVHKSGFIIISWVKYSLLMS